MEYLVHHGIKGQSWGVRNGPPYPLGIKIHRKVIAKAKEAGEKVKETGTKVRQSADNYRKNFDKKKAMKVGAIAAGAALAAVGGYYLYKSGALDSLVKNGKNLVKDLPDGVLGSEISGAKLPKADINSNDAGNLTKTLKTMVANSAKAGASISEIYNDKTYLDSINEAGGGKNCSSTSLAYIFHRLFGADFKAVPDSEITLEKQSIDYIKSFFKEGTINEIDPESKLGAGRNGSLFNNKLIDMIPNGSTGMLAFNFTNAHWVNYEKTSDGEFTLICNQNHRIVPNAMITKLVTMIPVPYKYCYRILDMSHAEVSEEGVKKLHEIVR